MEFLVDCRVIKLEKNAKDPIKYVSWKDPKNQYYIDEIDFDEFNYGIVTGIKNNIIVVDVDYKDDGVKYFNENVPCKIDTFTVKSPNNGFHIYFKYTSSDDKCTKLMKDYFGNKTGIYGVGIDIRTEGGYIVGPDSSINGKKYKIINDKPISEIPLTLVTWLVNGMKKTNGKYEVNNDLEYLMTDDEFRNILFQFKPTSYNEWLIGTTACKCHDKYDIWDEWCKSLKDGKYDKKKNDAMWNCNGGIIDINFICYCLKIPKVPTIKSFKPEDINIPNKIVYNNKFVYDKMFKGDQYNYKIFKAYDTHIIKSCCGTGKTTAVNAHMKKYMEKHTKARFLSIVTRQTLADQHVTSFKDINMKSYQNVDDSELSNTKSLVICLNSLWKMDDIDEKDIENTIVYIDEINSFLEFTHNDQLNHNLKRIQQFLMKLIKKAHKVIVSDATIRDNVFHLLSKRNIEQTIYLENEFKKFQNVPAVRVRDEELFYQKLYDQVKNNEPFFFGSSKASIVTDLYNKMKSEAPEELKQKFLLFTSEEHIKIHNANEQLKDKFIFYSPKITFGIDFNIDTPQNVYIYQHADSIMPSGSYQQTTRTRNIKTLYYYSEVEEQRPVYEDIDDVKKTLTHNIKQFQSVYNVCSYCNEHDELAVVKNMFFELYAYNEYTIDVFKTNMTKHFENILVENGFVLSEEGRPIKMDIQDRLELKTCTQEIQDQIFNEFLEAEDKTADKFKQIMKRAQLLKLPEDKSIYEAYESELKDKYELQNHLNIIRTLKDKKYISDKLQVLREYSFDVKTVSNIYNKILTLNNLEEKYKIKHLEVNYENEGNIHMTDAEYEYIKKLFRFRNTKDKPSTYDQLRSVYVNMIRHILPSNLIQSHRSKKKENRDKQCYTLNKKLLQYHLELNQYMNPNRVNFHNDIVDMFDIKVVPITDAKYEIFINDDPHDHDLDCMFQDD